MAELFSDALQKAVTKTLGVVELFGAANDLQRTGRADLAATLYREWLVHNPGDPLTHAVCFNYSVTLSELKDNAGARDALLQSLAANPGFMPSKINLGSAYERLGDALSAVNQWFTVVNELGQINCDGLSYKKTALKQIARVLEGANCEEKAEECLKHSLEIDPLQNDVLQHFVAIRQKQCKWPVIQPAGTLTRQNIKAGLAPLSMSVYTDDPLLQLATAWSHNKTDVGRPAKFYGPADFAGRSRDRNRKLRIGYVSSDFRGHAVGYLTAEVFGLHDRSKVEIYAYYCGPAADDATFHRIKGTVDHWENVFGMDQAQCAQLIVDQQVDILIDLNGYTNFGLFKMFAARPAPVIVNWLGFPGTMGSPYHHYIIADENIIPPGSEIYYSEEVLRLPCYQPNDRKRVVAPTPTRAEMGLPEGAMVYCCFNGAQKLTQPTFARWMDILHKVPNSVLWLLKGGENADNRLRELTVQYGIAPERVIYAERMPNAQHMARYQLADLFLDTLPYGAHTTASDALWMGVPVLTLPGRGFAARVCASLVSSAGLPELICASPDEYVRMAVELGHDPARRQHLRDKLLANRDTSVLFDTPNLVRHLEELYFQMFDAWVEDRLPQPDLTNLAIYQEIGIEGDHDTTEFAFKADYHEFYLEGLTVRDAFCPLPADSRLWKKQ